MLLGDAAHTAHFSIGSGTKLAMEDAIALAWAVKCDDIDAYEAERRPIVESTQRAAQGSLEWFEGIGRYMRQAPRTFAFNLLTRSRRITYGELRMRDPDFVDAVAPSPPMFTPFRLRSLELANRVVVSPMDMYTSVDGTPGDFHLVHLGARAIGGAGLVMTEMICTSARRPDHARAAAACTATSTSAPGSGSSTSCTRIRAPRSAARSGTPAARARPSCCGSARTSRCPTATGR